MSSIFLVATSFFFRLFIAFGQLLIRSDEKKKARGEVVQHNHHCFLLFLLAPCDIPVYIDALLSYFLSALPLFFSMNCGWKSVCLKSFRAQLL
ncbi:hypothetical protein L5515_018826 [Caenorhabditis briggsae]|uniref:Uncharacterized protein n=1 Tax=Caenorhabditis briggsae TaxID=6238 RepID=A0AAE9FKA9_CAEBR|nr:hypothetical protein L5515_018826 [Caenorhabditis briggsae]